jgi:hypothetical protein
MHKPTRPCAKLQGHDSAYILTMLFKQISRWLPSKVTDLQHWGSAAGWIIADQAYANAQLTFQYVFRLLCG